MTDFIQYRYTELLFVYGTLADIKIQQKLFNRCVPLEPDTIVRYVKKTIRLPDIPTGNSYPILAFSGKKKDKVEGNVLWLSLGELKNADFYEGESYLRKKVILESGLEVWCYVAH